MFVKKKEGLGLKKEVFAKRLQRNFDGACKRFEFNGMYFCTKISVLLLQTVKIFVDFRVWSQTVEVDPNFLRVNGIGVMVPGKQREFRGKDCMNEAFEWLSTFLLDLATRFAAQEGVVLAGGADYRENILKIIA